MKKRDLLEEAVEGVAALRAERGVVLHILPSCLIIRACDLEGFERLTKEAEMDEEPIELMEATVPCHRCRKPVTMQVDVRYDRNRRLPPKLCHRCTKREDPFVTGCGCKWNGAIIPGGN